MREIDVVVPCSGAVQYLTASLLSIVDQTGVTAFPIVIDDTRTPQESEAVARIVQSVPGARSIRNRGIGLVDALNTGVQAVETECFARMDSDDISLPGRLRTQHGYLTDHPSVVGVGGMVQYIDDEGQLLPEVDWLTQGIPLDPRDIRAELRRHNVLFHPTMLLRTEAVCAVGGYRSNFPHVEDYDLWLRLSLVGDLVNLSQTVLLYRIHEPQVGRVKAREQEASLERLRDAVRNGGFLGIGDNCPIQARRFAAVVFRDDDHSEDLSPLTSQSGYELSHVLFVTPSGKKPSFQDPGGDTTGEPLVQWCRMDSIVTQLQHFARQLPPDMPVAFFGPQSDPDPTRVARQVDHLLESHCAWTAGTAPSQSPRGTPNVLEPAAEEHLRSNLLAEARTLWPRGYTPHAQHPLVDLMSDWPIVKIDDATSAKRSARRLLHRGALTRILTYSDGRLRPRLSRLTTRLRDRALRSRKAPVSAESPSTLRSQPVHSTTSGSRDTGIRGETR